jgi:5-methylcytosine-specific restriction endonuclease McrA
MILKPCSICGRPSPTSRCEQHPKPPKRSGTYSRDAAKIRASATVCHICGKPFTPDDPAVADHIHPRAFGGSDHISNLAAAHKSCNGRKGATLPSWSERQGPGLARRVWRDSGPALDSRAA